MIETDKKKQREAEFTQKYTLTEQDFRKMILEKAERARVYSKAVRKREIAQEWLWTAKCNIVRERGPDSALKTCCERAD